VEEEPHIGEIVASPGWEVTVSPGAQFLDELAIREVRESLLLDLQTHRPDLSNEERLLIVDQALPQLVSQINEYLLSTGGAIDRAEIPAFYRYRRPPIQGEGSPA